MGRVELKKICKSYGDHRVLADIDLQIQPGELLVVLGSSGGGKTTLLNLLAGLITPSSGSILFDGDDVTGWDVSRRNIAYVFQDYALYPHMSVEQNVRFPLENQRMPRPQAEQKVRDILELLELEPVRHQFPAQLSGGQKQRVAIGRALVRDPFLFLFDEPMSSLDAQLQDRLRMELKQLHRKLNKTFVYVTHDQLSAMILGQRIAFLAENKIQQVAPPQELYFRPANIQVAKFLGFPPINLFSPREFASLATLAMPGGTERVGVRPEHMLLQEDVDGPHTLEWVQAVGHAVYGYFQFAGASVCARCEGPGAGSGRRAGCRIDLDHVMFFDRDGNRID